ncbi:MAG: sigma-70 family RNA polymerase sigma factor [Candidatus Tyrphobacter sp.]
MDDAARERHIVELLPLLRRIAGRVNRMVKGSDLGDLIGDGSIGLVRAVDAYDPQRGIPLERYARRLMLGTMLNGLRRMDPVSERVRQIVRTAERERYRLAVEIGRMPTREQMARRHPLLAGAARRVYQCSPLSLDAPLPAAECAGSTAACDPANVALENDERAYLRALVDALPERERRLVLAYYYGSASLRSVGEQLNISSQRASQLHIAAIGRLRKRIDAASYRR